jgi:uncharacterized membrane protein
METVRRSVLKALTWQLLATLITATIAFVVTGQLALAAVIGGFDTAVKLVAYYGHERVWNRVALGRRKPPEYQI